ncbi:TniQ family protein [uncultured Brachybacterium sp.]|uniref:TniQ family protein n=1 Tax=uncultured Brachybacterium sp. TaxID=189680 RepID=UPI002633BBF7|nr:TniQ family protein [uncultured Brachybacterium sp.]
MQPNSAPAPPDPPPDSRPRPRLIPGGYDLDTPPIHITPLPGESAVSWLRRAAVRYQISPRNVLRAGGASRQISSTRAATTRITSPRNAFTTRLGLSADERRLLRDPTPLGHALDSYARIYQHPNTSTTGTSSRFCPTCLAVETPSWDKDWTNPLLAVCPKHDLLLLDRCPACQAVPYTSPAWLSEPLKLWRCTARTSAMSGTGRRVRPWCGHDLRTTPAATATSEQSRAQRLLLDLTIDPDDPIDLCGITITRQIGFDAMVELLTAALHDRGTRFLDLSEPTGEIALGLADTLLVLETTDPGEAGDRLQELVLPTDRQAPITLNAATSSAKNPLLGALQLGRHREHLTATSQLAFRTGATHPRYPLPAKTPRASVHHLLLPEHTSPGLPLPLTRVPQVIWPGTLPGLDDSDPIVRAEISLLIAHLGTTRPWSHLTLDLGLPRTFHSALARRIRTRRAHGTWPTLLAQLDELLEHLQAHPPWPNYRHRRILADDLLLLERVLVTADPDQRLPALAVQRRFWELFTGGDALFAPNPLAILADQHAHWRQERHELDDKQMELFETAFQILDRSSPLLLGRPLSWKPP